MPAISAAAAAARRGGREARRSSLGVSGPRLPLCAGGWAGTTPQPVPAPAESGAARRLEAPRALLRKLRGGSSQGRVLLAAAPGTSQPPRRRRRRRRRRSHRDRKPSRRPERPLLAPRVVPDEGWPRVTLHASWPQAAALAPGHPELSPEDPSRGLGRPPSVTTLPAPPRPLPAPSPSPAAGTGGARSRHFGRAGTPAPGALQLGAWCRERLPTVVCRDRGGEHGAPKLWARRSRVSAAPISHPFCAIKLEAWGLGSPGGSKGPHPWDPTSVLKRSFARQMGQNLFWEPSRCPPPLSKPDTLISPRPRL